MPNASLSKHSVSTESLEISRLLRVMISRAIAAAIFNAKMSGLSCFFQRFDSAECRAASHKNATGGVSLLRDFSPLRWRV
jgi:hypothetical protein